MNTHPSKALTICFYKLDVFLGGRFCCWVWHLSCMVIIFHKYVHILSYELVSELWISCISINGYSPCFPNPFSQCRKGCCWQWVTHLSNMESLSFCGLFGLPVEGGASPHFRSSPPHCGGLWSQRHLQPGAPQPVPLITCSNPCLTFPPLIISSCRSFGFQVLFNTYLCWWPSFLFSHIGFISIFQIWLYFFFKK